MDESEQIATLFEAHRRHLQAVAYRMLGFVSEADDAVQEAWIRLNRSPIEGISNLKAWLTTVVGRVCTRRLLRGSLRVARVDEFAVTIQSAIQISRARG